MNDNRSDEQFADEISAVLVAAADEAFPDERLQRQRTRILQRVDQSGRPGRLIAFPAGQGPPTRSLLQPTSTTRWVAAAAVVAFIAGVVAGQRLPNDYHVRSPRQVAVSRPGAPQAAGTTLRASAPLVPSDDEFLGEVELAAESRPAVLRHIDALTPRAWDVEVGQ